MDPKLPRNRPNRQPSELEIRRLVHVRMMGTALGYGPVVFTIAEEVLRPHAGVGLYELRRGFQAYVIVKINKEYTWHEQVFGRGLADVTYTTKLDELVRQFGDPVLDSV